LRRLGQNDGTVRLAIVSVPWSRRNFVTRFDIRVGAGLRRLGLGYGQEWPAGDVGERIVSGENPEEMARIFA